MEIYWVSRAQRAFSITAATSLPQSAGIFNTGDCRAIGSGANRFTNQWITSNKYRIYWKLPGCEFSGGMPVQGVYWFLPDAYSFWNPPEQLWMHPRSSRSCDWLMKPPLMPESSISSSRHAGIAWLMCFLEKSLLRLWRGGISLGYCQNTSWGCLLRRFEPIHDGKNSIHCLWRIFE